MSSSENIQRLDPSFNNIDQIITQTDSLIVQANQIPQYLKEYKTFIIMKYTSVKNILLKVKAVITEFPSEESLTDKGKLALALAFYKIAQFEAWNSVFMRLWELAKKKNNKRTWAMVGVAAKAIYSAPNYKPERNSKMLLIPSFDVNRIRNAQVRAEGIAAILKVMENQESLTPRRKSSLDALEDEIAMEQEIEEEAFTPRRESSLEAMEREIQSDVARINAAVSRASPRHRNLTAEEEEDEIRRLFARGRRYRKRNTKKRTRKNIKKRNRKTKRY